MSVCCEDSTRHSYVLVRYFFLGIPPAPRSTLFPYTTLFRSIGILIGIAIPVAIQMLFLPANLRVPVSGLSVDRKSTRLNSSHQIISYAVSCLKKKPSPPTRQLCATAGAIQRRETSAAQARMS